MTLQHGSLKENARLGCALGLHACGSSSSGSSGNKMRAVAVALMVVFGLVCPVLISRLKVAHLPPHPGLRLTPNAPESIRGVDHRSSSQPSATRPLAFPPGLYMQGADDAAPQASPWYVVSAYMDTRPLAFGEPGGVAMVAGGPRDEVRKGKAWIAVISSSGPGLDRRRRRHVATIQCSPTRFTWFDTIRPTRRTRLRRFLQRPCRLGDAQARAHQRASGRLPRE